MLQYSLKKSYLFRCAKGLSCLGFLDEVQRHADIMKVLLIDQNIALDAVTLELTFQVSLSEDGSKGGATSCEPEPNGVIYCKISRVSSAGLFVVFLHG